MFMFAFSLITIALLIAVSIYCYVIKYQVNQKDLLPFHFTRNKSKEIVYEKCKSKMSSKVKDIGIKNRTCYFFNDIINIKNFDPNNNKIDKKSYKNILVYYIGSVTINYLKYVKIYSSVNPLHLFNKVNGYFKEINENKYLTLVPTNESKEKIKKYEELWSKIRDLIRSITKNSDDFDEK